MLHDLISPRVILLVGLLISTASAAAIPFGSSPIPYLVFLHMGLLIGLSPITTNPLLVDYVEKESLGVAQGWMHIAMSVGTLFTNYSVFEVVKRLDLRWAFIGLIAIIALCAIGNFFLLKDVRKNRRSELRLSGRDTIEP